MSEPDPAALRDLYRSKPASDPPCPWRSVPLYVAGVTAVGFGPGSELVLVLSHAGLGVVDPATGETVADPVDDEEHVPDPYPISATGIGPLEGTQVPLAGLWGGGLRTTTPDGWVVHRAAPEWPSESAVLCPPDAPELYDDLGRATLLLKDSDPGIRALGFSDSGRTLVVATTQLYIWTR